VREELERLGKERAQLIRQLNAIERTIATVERRLRKALAAN